jgi:hypothetical protein
MRNLKVRFGFVQRSKNQSAQNRVSYQRYRFVQRGLQVKTFSQPGERLIHSSLLLPIKAPQWAKHETVLWQRVSDAENRRGSVEARTLDVSLPRALPVDASVQSMQALAQWFANLDICVQLDVHVSLALDGLQNPHAHFLIGTRALGSTGFSAEKSQRLELCFRQERGRWLRRHIVNIVNQFAIQAVGHKLVQAGPKLLVLRPEPRLPRWAVKTELGKEFLHDRCHIHLIDEFRIKEAGIRKAIDGLTDEIGDLDWWISGYLGQLPTYEQRVNRALDPHRNTQDFSSENRISGINRGPEADEPNGYGYQQADSDIKLDNDVDPQNEIDPSYDEEDCGYDGGDDYRTEMEDPDTF